MGLIRNDERFRQRLSFEGLDRGGVYPTYIDLELELKNQLFIFAQYHYNRTPMATGVQLLLERKVDRIQASLSKEFGGEARAFALDVNHWTPTDQDIPAEKGYIRRVYVKGKWRFDELAPKDMPHDEVIRKNLLPYDLRMVGGFIDFFRNKFNV